MANGIITILNLTLSRLFAFLMAPVTQWPLTALIICSAITGVLLAIAFRYTSNQTAIGRAADRSRAELLAINLFQDDLAGVFKSLGSLLRHAVSRVAHSIPPVLVIIIPLLLLFIQLATWYEYRPLEPGESAIVQMEIDRDHWQQAQHAKLQPPTGARVQAGPLRDVGQLTLYWRIEHSGSIGDGIQSEQLQWDVQGDVVEKSLVTSDGSRDLWPVDARRAGSVWWDHFLHPSEPALSDGGAVSGIVIHYPKRVTPVFGWDWPWWLTFLVVSMLSAIAVKPLVGVKF